MVNTIAFLLIVFGFIFQYQDEASHIFNYIFNNTYISDLYSDTIHWWNLDFTMHADNCFDIQCGNDCNGGEKYQRQLLNMHSLCECPH